MKIQVKGSVIVPPQVTLSNSSPTSLDVAWPASDAVDSPFYSVLVRLAGTDDAFSQPLARP